MMRMLGVDVHYDLSPQARRKIERPCLRLPDRIVLTCTPENMPAVEDGQAVLKVKIHLLSDTS